MAPTILTPRVSAVDVQQDGERVIVIRNGQAILDLPYDAAKALARALHVQALKAEEIAKAAGIVEDSAILMRAGAPFALTNHPALLDEARKEAAWNTKLRRAMPGGVKSREVFGRPTIIQEKPHGD